MTAYAIDRPESETFRDPYRVSGRSITTEYVLRSGLSPCGWIPVTLEGSGAGPNLPAPFRCSCVLPQQPSNAPAQRRATVQTLPCSPALASSPCRTTTKRPCWPEPPPSRGSAWRSWDLCR